MDITTSLILQHIIRLDSSILLATSTNQHHTNAQLPMSCITLCRRSRVIQFKISFILTAFMYNCHVTVTIQILCHENNIITVGYIKMEPIANVKLSEMSKLCTNIVPPLSPMRNK